MADLSITQTRLADGKIRYELGGRNWEDRRVPDIRRPGATVQIDEQRLIDVIILGDGFTAPSDFRDALEDWLDKFYAIKVYDVFAGCIRVRALYTPSDQPASANGGSYYGCLTSADGKSLVGADSWKDDDTAGAAFREAFWESVDTFADASPRRYPSNLDIGSSAQDITSDEVRDLYRNLVVSLLVRSEDDKRPSGFAGTVSRPEPDQSPQLRVAFGVNELHEFGHAFGLLSDEYIDGTYACEDIEERLSDLRSQKDDLDEGLDGPPPISRVRRATTLW